MIKKSNREDLVLNLVAVEELNNKVGRKEKANAGNV